ncbi:MAG: response regulator [Phenylobacterium sp.]|jgi:DNA-binding response OmpR family regulator|uniref:response regulator n=1 Tax=Phenylobacterium sp. TaxID=1871053 RepID=UPI002A369E03|nr:response regulator [Phenylobacterium sp.]MDX9996508.1 response regulator [Phenylobacterium sp.]
MALSATSRARFNLSEARIMLLEATPLGMQVLVQILSGFGAKDIVRATNTTEARDYLDVNQFDLMVVDTLGPEGHGYDFVHWLRRSEFKMNRHVPVLMTTGHTRAADVQRARDCGAHFIMAKPLTAIGVLERILWIAREGRQFVECDRYVGPDRRFRDIELPPGHPRRRRTDKIIQSALAADAAGGEALSKVAS